MATCSSIVICLEDLNRVLVSDQLQRVLKVFDFMRRTEYILFSLPQRRSSKIYASPERLVLRGAFAICTSLVICAFLRATSVIKGMISYNSSSTILSILI